MRGLPTYRRSRWQSVVSIELRAVDWEVVAQAQPDALPALEEVRFQSLTLRGRHRADRRDRLGSRLCGLFHQNRYDAPGLTIGDAYGAVGFDDESIGLHNVPARSMSSIRRFQ